MTWEWAVGIMGVDLKSSTLAGRSFLKQKGQIPLPPMLVKGPLLLVGGALLLFLAFSKPVNDAHYVSA